MRFTQLPARPGHAVVSAGLRTWLMVLTLLLSCACQAQDGAAGSNAASSTTAAAAQAPAELSVFGTGWKAKGTGALRFFGFKAYDITLWLPASATGNFSFGKPFALDITYNTTVTRPTSTTPR